MESEKKASPKYNTPLVVTQIIQPYANNFGHLLERVDSEGLLKLVHKDPSSDFYFVVKQYKVQDNQVFLTLDFKPRSSTVPASYDITVKVEEVDVYFSRWVELVEAYAKTTLFGDDKILQAYEDEYFASFEIVDNDAETMPFALKEIYLLDEHLDELGQKVQSIANDKKSPQLHDIANDIENLRDQLSSKPKKWVMRRFANVWAKITKQGPKLMKEILLETRTEAIKQMIKALITNVPDLLQ